MKPRVMVLYGQGINCDNETARAFEEAGADAQKVLPRQLEAGKFDMNDFDLIGFPGGFSYGDDLGAGKVMAVEFNYRLREMMQRFVESEKPVLGICNGFQIMVKMGFLPGFDGDYKTQRVTLTGNDSGMFEDRWVHLDVNNKSPCIFTKGIDRLHLPVRHAEGKFYAEPDTMKRMDAGGQVVATYVGPNDEIKPGYPWNPNGSLEDMASICDPTGLMFGLMPHPEACRYVHHYPTWTRDRATAEAAVARSRQIFKNAVDYVKG